MLNNIEAERVRKRISKKQIADEMKVSPKTYYNWIVEQTDIPGSALLKLAALFGVEIEYLLEGSKYATGDKTKQEVV